MADVFIQATLSSNIGALGGSFSANIDIPNPSATLTITSPMGRISGAITESTGGLMTATLPSIKLYGAMGGSGVASIPALTLKASGKITTIATFYRVLPAVRLTASGNCHTYASGNSKLPAIRISASAHINPLATLSRPIPALLLTARGTIGTVGKLNKSVPAIKLTASAYLNPAARLSIPIPALRLHARGRGTIASYSLNTRNLLATKYTNYSFNSLCVFNGKTIGAKNTGIFELTGSTDSGTPIPWKIATGYLDTTGCRLRHAWVSGDADGDLTLSIIAADGTRYEYIAEPVSSSPGEIRTKFGKGIHSRYITVELKPNHDSGIAPLVLSRIVLFGEPMPGKKR